MRLFFAVVAAERDQEFSGMSTWAVANDKDQAVGKLLRVAHATWPVSAGWHSHQVGVGTAIEPLQTFQLTLHMAGHVYRAALLIEEVT